MTTESAVLQSRTDRSGRWSLDMLAESLASAAAVPLGRLLFALVFIAAAPGHFAQATIDYAAAQGIAFAPLLVPLSGVIALAGGLSVALGYRTRLGAWLLVLFLVPVTLTMHRFWTLQDPAMAQLDQAMFFKNVALIGGALLLSWYGAGPVSLDGRRESR